jgi:hypothetical protein
LYSDPKELIFKSLAEVKAFSKWFLGTTLDSSPEVEFKSEEEKDDYLSRRMARLEIQVDNLRNLNLEKPCITVYKDQLIYKLVKEGHKELTPEHKRKRILFCLKIILED